MGNRQNFLVIMVLLSPSMVSQQHPCSLWKIFRHRRKGLTYVTKRNAKELHTPLQRTTWNPNTSALKDGKGVFHHVLILRFHGNRCCGRGVCPFSSKTPSAGFAPSNRRRASPYSPPAPRRAPSRAPRRPRARCAAWVRSSSSGAETHRHPSP